MPQGTLSRARGCSSKCVVCTALGSSFSTITQYAFRFPGQVKKSTEHGVVVHTCQPSTWEAEAGELQV